MIENRSRLEKQIFLGRQSVRRAMQGRANERTAKIESHTQDRVSPNMGTKLTLSNAPFISSQALSEDPLPMDTDAEALLINGVNGRASPTQSTQQLHPHSQHDSPEAGPSRPRQLRPRQRLSRSSFHRERDSGFEGDFGGATPDPPPPPSGSETDRYTAHYERVAPHHATLLRRLSKTSSLRATFNSLRRPPRVSPSERELAHEQTWSEDSSSDDDDLSVLSRRRSTRYPSAIELHADLGRQLSDASDDDGQVDQDD